MSSKMKISVLEKRALAKATRCFCPPDRVIPRLPIKVRSPLGRLDKSYVSEVASRTVSYHSSSTNLSSETPQIALLMVPLCSHGD